VTGERPSGERARQLAPGVERRRSQRVVIRIGVTLHYAEQGRPASVRAYTLEVNDHGAMLICAHSFPAATKLELQHARTRQRQWCHVTRAPRETSEGFQIPVEFETPMKGFWQISFPSTNWKPTEG